jgi:hypothetical protein
MDEMKLQGTGRMDHTTELKKNFRLNHIYIFIYPYIFNTSLKKDINFFFEEGKEEKFV